MSDLIKDLKSKEQKIRELQQKKAKQEGQREQLINQLRTEFGVETPEEAVEKLDSMQRELEENKKQLGEINDKLAEIINKAETN